MNPAALADLPSPCYVLDRSRLHSNLEVLAGIRRETGCRILLALKAFAMWSEAAIIMKYLDGTCASGLFEARLGRTCFGGEVHTFSPAYRQEEFAELLHLSDHIIFNSLSQWEHLGEAAVGGAVKFGLRINPECSTGHTPLYDPCAPGCRLGLTAAEMPARLPDGITGLHFHTLCEQPADALAKTLQAVETKFGRHLAEVDWLNLGGGHHITRPDYDRELLCRLITHLQHTYHLKILLEPGEAVALNAGCLMATVLDVLDRDPPVALLDTSAAAHMPDVLEMPYRPPLQGAGSPGEKRYDYELGGSTCLAGDRIGAYSFDAPLQPGDRLLFEDMAHYTMVKNNTFNGVPLPAIAVTDEHMDRANVIRSFGFEDYKDRLG